MTTGIISVLQLISTQYNIPYDDLLLLVNENRNKIVKQNKQSHTKIYEYITVDGNDYIYQENTNTVYTYEKQNPKETMKEYGYICPDTCDIIMTRLNNNKSHK